MGGLIGASIAMVIIIIEMIINSVLLDRIEKERDENKKYYTKLRREYDMRLEQYREDIAVRDQIIMDYRALNGR